MQSAFFSSATLTSGLVFIMTDAEKGTGWTYNTGLFKELVLEDSGSLDKPL